MHNRRRWLSAVVIAAFMIPCIYFGAKQIGQGKVSAYEGACLLVLVFLFGAMSGNYLRNRLLHEALLTLGYAFIGLGEWFHSRETLFPTLWGLMALLSAFIFWTRWNAAPSSAGQGES
jgi:hypothetical protein